MDSYFDFFFFFKQKTAYEMRISDWSSDVCSSDLPAPPTDHYADRTFPPGEMERVRADLHKEHGGGTFHQVMFNLAEYQARKGGDGFRWDGEAWFGGDVNRLVLKSEGEGAFNGGVDSAEIQALYSSAINPYWNVQAGVRDDFQPNPSRTYEIGRAH